MHLEALAGVDFLFIVVPAPAVLGNAEQQVHQAAQRQEQVAHEEVLQIQHSAAEHGKAVPCPHVVAQHAGQRKQSDEHEVHQTGLLAAAAGQLHAAADDVLEHGQHGGKRRKGHEQEEQGAPQPAHGHVGKDVGQGNEDQAGAAGLVHTVGEAGREDDETGGDGHEGIQHHDAGGLAQQGVLLADVAAKDGHCANAKAQGEEGLIHGGHQRVDHAHLFHALEVGHEEEAQAFLCAGHEQAVDGQHHHDHQQGDHHDLGHALKAVLQALGAYKDAQCHHEHHPEGHHAGVCQHFGKLASHLIGVQACQLTGGGHVEIVQHPACHGGVEHHEQIAANEGEVAVDVPLLARLFQCLIGPHRAFAGSAAHCKLHGHDGQAQNDEEDQVEQHERAAAALTGNIRELPHVANADGTARRKQNEAHPGLQFFSFHDSKLLVFRSALPCPLRGRAKRCFCIIAQIWSKNRGASAR